MFMSSYTIGKGNHSSIRYLKQFFSLIIFIQHREEAILFERNKKNTSDFPRLINLRVAFVEKPSNLWVKRPEIVFSSASAIVALYLHFRIFFSFPVPILSMLILDLSVLQKLIVNSECKHNQRSLSAKT